MTGKTHLMGGIASTVVAAQFTNYDPALFITAGAIGSLIPDICHGGSKIGRKLPMLSKIINKLFGHRTFTHSMLFLVLIGYVLTLITSNESVIFGVILGMVSHLLLDASTKNGIKLLYPSALTFRFPVTAKTGGSAEKVVLILLTLVTIYFGKDLIL
ncbi:inner membrane protein [Gracilibacillus ureilyticus]|uniref:Inner membrane protein n=1 Tax=Gracilibacillus ureilyticus TaxID=531814 RepID=A0A1H9NBH9_9BACI|nr:metal-dependent hydrolase [Gracilibacillus ureilyticus]SER33304.1 inner membrane protein [Gracilibacillus ureilyticus]